MAAAGNLAATAWPPHLDVHAGPDESHCALAGAEVGGRSKKQRMIAPSAKFLDWSAIQIIWGRRLNSLLKHRRNALNPRLEEALAFLNGPDFIPTESQPARPEFNSAKSGHCFCFPTPRPSKFPE